MGVEAAVPAVLDLGERDVEGARALLLQLVVIELRVVAEYNLSDGVGEVDLVGEAGPGLDHRGLAAGAKHDQVSRLRQGRLPVRGRDEKEMDRRLQDRPGRQMNERAVLDERGIERRQRVALVIGVAGQFPLDEFRPLSVRGTKAPDVCATGAGSARRKLCAVTAVDEHEADGGVPWRNSGQTVELLQSRRPRLLGRGELDLRERSKACVLPVLVLRRREPQLGETRERRLAE